MQLQVGFISRSRARHAPGAAQELATSHLRGTRAFNYLSQRQDPRSLGKTFFFRGGHGPQAAGRRSQGPQAAAPNPKSSGWVRNPEP